MLEIGNRMPDFSAADQNGNIVKSADLIGKKTVVYFYPKANTPGCTAEACSLRDNYERFLALGYNVIGISKDSVKAQKNFSDKYALPFPLLADTDALIIKAHGAKKSSMERLTREFCVRHSFSMRMAYLRKSLTRSIRRTTRNRFWDREL